MTEPLDIFPLDGACTNTEPHDGHDWYRKLSPWPSYSVAWMHCPGVDAAQLTWAKLTDDHDGVVVRIGKYIGMVVFWSDHRGRARFR